MLLVELYAFFDTPFLTLYQLITLVRNTFLNPLLILVDDHMFK